VPTSLEAILAPGFEANLYKAATANLQDHSNPLRLSNYAYAARELSRHLLHRLAPDDEVRACVWYKSDPARPGQVTRAQRAQYAIQGGLSEDYVRETLNVDIDDIKRRLTKAIDNLSKFTHIEESVFALPTHTVDAHVASTEAALTDLCDTIHTCRRELLDALSEKIDDAIVDATLRETILEIDELASHHSIEEVYTDDVTVARISADRIELVAEGTIGVELQWGSGSDRARGDGAEISDNFPFSCNLSCPVDDPNNVEADEDSLRVDTSSWRFSPDDDEE
jgi:hypothetical protein